MLQTERMDKTIRKHKHFDEMEVFQLLAKFGAPVQGFTPADFNEEGPFFRTRSAPVGIDILTFIPGVD